MKIIFTSHALLKLIQREIPRRMVTEALKSPDYKISSYSNRLIAYKKFVKLYLKVVYKIEGNNILVITQYWVKKLK